MLPLRHVVVVGAGIAGLTAAYQIQKRGLGVTVFESGNRIGGRMTSDVVGAHIVDRGAQAIFSGASTLIGLTNELALTHALEECIQSNLLLRAGALRNTRSDQLLPPLLSDILSLRDWLKFDLHMRGLAKNLKIRPLSDYSAWADIDKESTETWCRREFGSALIDYHFEPLLSSLQFQTPAVTSKALALWLSTQALHQNKTLTLRDGLGTLPEALAARLNIQLNTPIRAIEVSKKCVYVTTDKERMTVDSVILATPAGQARAIYSPREEAERRVLATPYASALNVFMLLHPGFSLPRKLRSACSILLPECERKNVAAIGMARNKYPSRSKMTDQTLINVTPSPNATEHLLEHSDKTIIETLLPELENYLPGIGAELAGGKIFRWREAVPRSFVGRAANIAQYRQTCTEKIPRLLLAGDYLGLPNTEGAAESGIWAANMIEQRQLLNR